MNIVLISEEYYPKIGGGGMVVSNLAREFKHGGHGVTVVASRNPRSLKPREVIDGIDVFRLDFLFPYRPLRLIVRFCFLFPLTLMRLAHIIRSKNCQVVNVHFITPRVLVPVLLLRPFMRFQFVASVHGEDVQSIPNQSRMSRWVVRRGLMCADSITGCSASILEDVRRLVPENNVPMAAIRNGIDLSEFGLEERYRHSRPYILAVGRFVHKKGFDILISGYKNVTERYSHIDLMLAGDGSEKAKCEALTEELGISDRVRFLGYVNRTEVVELYNGCEFFVLPSRREPLGITNLEAMAAGKAVVATCVGGVPEIIRHGHNGLLVKSDNPEELGKGMMLLIEDRPLARRLGSMGRSYVESNHDWRVVALTFLKSYEGVAPDLSKNCTEIGVEEQRPYEESKNVV